MLKTYSDGASRVNPGPSAIAFIILDEDDKVLKKDSRLVGIRTNNQAEYEALISALECASTLGREVTCYLDSQLVARQLSGETKIENPELRTLWRKVIALKMRFNKTSVIWVPRTDRHIQEVDSLVNQLLDDIVSRQ